MYSLTITYLRGSYSIEDINTTTLFYSLFYYKMKNYTISIGLNDKNTKMQEINTLDAFKIVTNLIIQHFGWWTINEWKGVYTHENWEIVIENSLICSIITDKDTSWFINDVKKLLNQESVMKEEIISKITFE